MDRAWAKLGMTIKQSKDVRALFYHEGQLILTTKRSHGSGPIKGNIPTLIRQQMKLTEGQFRDLITCPLGLAEYVGILKQRGLIPQTASERR